MNVTSSLQIILCAGVTDLVLPRGTTELLAPGGEGRLIIRERVRLKPKRPSAPVRSPGVQQASREAVE